MLDYNKRYVYSGTHQYFCDWIRSGAQMKGRALRYDGTVGKHYVRCYFRRVPVRCWLFLMRIAQWIPLGLCLA